MPLSPRWSPHSKTCLTASDYRFFYQLFDRTLSNPRLSYVTSGIERAAEEAGARVLYVDDVTFKMYKKITVSEGTYLKETLVNR